MKEQKIPFTVIKSDKKRFGLSSTLFLAMKNPRVQIRK